MRKAKRTTKEGSLESGEFEESNIYQHAVLICYLFPHGKLDSDKAFNAVIAFQRILEDILDEEVGYLDGHEFCESSDLQVKDSLTFFLYGQDADKIYEAISPVIYSLPYLPGSYVVKRFGNSDRADEQVFL